MSAPTTVTGPGIDPCPYCGGITRVQPCTGTPPKVQAWSCTACGTEWAITVVNPRPFLDHLAETVELAAARSVLREAIALADAALALTNDQLRAHLADLARATRSDQQPAGCHDG